MALNVFRSKLPMALCPNSLQADTFALGTCAFDVVVEFGTHLLARELVCHSLERSGKCE